MLSAIASGAVDYDPENIIVVQLAAQPTRYDYMGWKTLSTKTVYENPWIRVCEDRVINPGGGQNDYGHVHFKNRAVAIVPLDQNGNTWLVGQDRYTLGEYSWELPMGGAPLDEAPLQAAKRELKEETGLTAETWELLMKLHTSNSITDEVALVYVARDLTAGETEFEETEDLAVKRLPLQDAINMALDGRISDAVCVAALLRVAPSSEERSEDHLGADDVAQRPAGTPTFKGITGHKT